MDRIHSYPKVYNLGHAAIADLLDGEVVVQEKVDGSQFNFANIGGELHMRSKGARRHRNEADKLFKGAVETAASLFDAGELPEGRVYRGEALWREKHNTLEYGRVPEGNVVLFDVDVGLEDRMGPDELQAEGERLGLEVVPHFYTGEVDNKDTLDEWMQRESFLGGCKIEGVVIKRYDAWNDRDGKMLMGKHVSERFKEKHQKDWRQRNPSRTDIIEDIIETYKHPGRWRKAVQHLRERGELEGAPQDIGALIEEVQRDVKEEEAEEIGRHLFEHFWKHRIRKAITGGLPEWYKEQLAEQQFEAA